MKTEIIKINEAVAYLNIPEKASYKEIKKIYKDLLYQWHPDRCKEEKELCHEQTRKIIQSYKIIQNYCENYRLSFNEHELEGGTGVPDPVKFWYERFGDDPIWG